MNSYEIVEGDKGRFLVRDDGSFAHADILDLIFEVFRQNPRYAELWLQLGQEYVFLNTEVTEA